MAKKTKILVLGAGKNKRQWELDEDQFERFESMFEEQELVPSAKYEAVLKLVETAPPPRIIIPKLT